MADYLIVNPIHAREGEVVDIHWRLKTGQVYIERYTCPPEDVLKERMTKPEKESER